MRLSKLKLAGFKSFVEPTTLLFPSNRVGVIGPNGCGKSNVIDAVRWVMGESSAKNLRGGAMTDVIFNGSSKRQKADKAYIELVFDEVELEKYEGQDEISVRREINRKAQSTYFLNGVKCRRKDITDLFLGTGLGPRSYSIIEQGMISRLIEAKPDDLRIFFEEAAGISKYKERRKETEQRMKQTRDNMARLDEIRGELDKQLNKLQKQAKEAEKYKELKESEHLLRGQLLAIRWQDLDTDVQAQQQQIEESAGNLQADLLSLHELEEKNTQGREDRIQAQKQLDSTQERFYTIDGEMNRLQQSIEHSSERNEQLQWDLEQVEDSLNTNRGQLEQDQQQLDDLAVDIAESEAQLDSAQESEQETQFGLEQTEAQLQDWQLQWDEFNLKAAEPTQRSQVEKTRLEHLENQLDQSQQRLFKLETESQQIDVKLVENELKVLEGEMDGVKSELDESDLQLAEFQASVTHLRDETQHLSSELHQNQTKLNQLTGRLSSLEVLQEAALSQNDDVLNQWLAAQNLTDAEQIAQAIQVETGWELAVETVLGSALQALRVANFDNLTTSLQNPPTGHLFLFLENSATQSIPENSLLQKVSTDLDLAPLLAHIKMAEDVEQAFAMQADLLPHESIITKQGVWLGQNWLCSEQGGDAQTSVLAREQEIKHIKAELVELNCVVEELEQRLDIQRDALRQADNQRDQTQAQVNEIRHQYSQLQSQHGGKSARLENLKLQVRRLNDEKDELKQRIEQDSENLDITRENLYQALDEMEKYADEREQLSQQKAVLQEAVLQARQRYQMTKENRHQVQMRLETMRTDHQRLQQGIQRLEERLEQLSEQKYELEQNMQKNDPVADLREELENFSQEKAAISETLAEAKQTVENIENSLTEYEEQRRQLEACSTELREQLEKLKMDCQGKEVRRQTIEEQLEEQELSALSLLAELPEYADEESWLSQIEAVERKLSRLGSVNMAALEEYQEEQNRKEYLDQQSGDLTESLQTLENAIRSIDRETRNRFKHTIESVNTSLQMLFPRLFGGGQAYLEIVGDDLLKSGVTIMARPPGKRNSTIHLLSGGEKALTAIALVFSIFELNPSPFCMLDEVDAPLDDTNVGRFCELVKDMSDRVQIIFISHNKIAMEMAKQLIGVTMQEAGVSRPVPVDVDAAVEMILG
ncbi:chromosome segregation protein SMC [Candidatus Albibeggiatoa sp. nov. BB20]|uniref:chromosome segregation protein SMC n=1 Tax=Candidatus Albibeggiatoa sp. nov. BB20 TaxID=3162723 RepID=UPI0033653459